MQLKDYLISRVLWDPEEHLGQQDCYAFGEPQGMGPLPGTREWETSRHCAAFEPPAAAAAARAVCTLPVEPAATLTLLQGGKEVFSTWVPAQARRGSAASDATFTRALCVDAASSPRRVSAAQREQSLEEFLAQRGALDCSAEGGYRGRTATAAGK